MQIRGSITALATPFAEDGAPDLTALARLVERQVDAGTQALVIAGSTGEAAMLEDAEYESLLRAAVEAAAGRVPVLAGCGLSGTARTIAQTQRARACGVDAALVVTPPYVRPTQSGLVAHYRAVAAEGGLPLVLYNVPGRTGVDLQPETVAGLRDVPGVVGVKEAVGDPRRVAALAALRRPGFAVLSGDDPTARAALLAGFDGVISVASNVAPGAFRRLCDAVAADAAGSVALDLELRPLYDFLGCAPNPIPLKAILAQLSLCADVVRLPLLPLPPELRAGLPGLAAAVEALERGPRP